MLYDKYDDDRGPMLELHGVLHHLTVSQTEPSYKAEQFDNAAFLDVNWGQASCMLDQEDINELAAFFGRLANGDAAPVQG